MKDKYYAVTMYRWNDHSAHSYFIGIFNKKQKAINEGMKEQIYRGGKYTAEVLECKMNQSHAEDKCKTFKVIPTPEKGMVP